MASLFSNVGKDAIESSKRERDPNDPMIHVVEFRLREQLKNRGIKQKELAKMTGLRPNAITNICRGNLDRVSLHHIGKIATALNITDIREILTLVQLEEAEFFNMANSLGLDDEDDE